MIYAQCHVLLTDILAQSRTPWSKRPHFGAYTPFIRPMVPPMVPIGPVDSSLFEGDHICSVQRETFACSICGWYAVELTRIPVRSLRNNHPHCLRRERAQGKVIHVQANIPMTPETCAVSRGLKNRVTILSYIIRMTTTWRWQVLYRRLISLMFHYWIMFITRSIKGIRTIPLNSLDYSLSVFTVLWTYSRNEVVKSNTPPTDEPGEKSREREREKQ